MANQRSRNIRLGIMVLSGLLLLVTAMYVIGNKKNLFGSTFQISAYFENVNGLMEGNNVRLAGVDVGTVNGIEIINDSLVLVEMVIENKYRTIIKKNAMVSLGTDGLMGNKLVKIVSVNLPSSDIEDGDVLSSFQPFETESMLRTLEETNEGVSEVVENLKLFSEKMNDPNSFWGLLSDTNVSNSISSAIIDIQKSGKYTVSMTRDLSAIIKDVRDGKGAIGEIIQDTLFSIKLNKTMTNLQNLSDSLMAISSDFNTLTQQITRGEGAVGTILSDTLFDQNLNKTMENLKNSSEKLDENLDALKQSIFFRRYFKKKEKETEKNK